jgi:hypothetical protein
MQVKRDANKNSSRNFLFNNKKTIFVDNQSERQNAICLSVKLEKKKVN